MVKKNIQQKSLEFSLEDIKARIKGSIGREILFYDTVDSTNTIAEMLAEKGKAEGTVIIADSQVKGRGRLGRSWVSPPGMNIYMSIILRPEIESKDITLVTIMTAIGCTIALRKVTGLNVTIKWPNDLIISKKKIGGILTEVKMAYKRMKYAITGIGINVNMDSDAFIDEIKDIATSVKIETGEPCSRAEICREILNEIDHWYALLKEMRRNVLLSEWQQLTSTLGREVKITTGKETFTGFAESINDEGMLIVRLQSGALRLVRSGDLTIVR
jgi:BirA family biotin operon repressor/biotin-[acetyl-CoA-carboxylase] ligase